MAKIGIEATGTYGAGLARFVRAHGLEVVEVDRPDRRTRRCLGKSDPIDAEAAARATLPGVAPTTPRPVGTSRDGPGAAGGPSGAMKPRVAAGGQLRDLADAAPKSRAASCDLPDHQGAGPRLPGPATRTLRDPGSATKAALRAWPGAGTTCRRNWTPWTSSSPSWSARPRQRCWPARHWPGQRRATAGDRWRQPGAAGQRGRLRGCVAWLRCPPPPGRTDRHRLNRGGDRHANRALWRITLVRMHRHEPTKTYLQRRTQQGPSMLDITRCPKRYVAREAYHHLVNQPDPPPGCQK